MGRRSTTLWIASRDHRPHSGRLLLWVTSPNQARVEAGKLKGADAIGLRVGKVVNQYKVAKHFELTIAAASFSFARKRDSIAAEAALDGLYIIRTSVPSAQTDAEDPSVDRNRNADLAPSR